MRRRMPWCKATKLFLLDLVQLYKALGGGWQEELKTASVSSKSRY